MRGYGVEKVKYAFGMLSTRYIVYLLFLFLFPFLTFLGKAGKCRATRKVRCVDTSRGVKLGTQPFSV
jgi:hypothetical protein